MKMDIMEFMAMFTSEVRAPEVDESNDDGAYSRVKVEAHYYEFMTKLPLALGKYDSIWVIVD